VDSVHFTALRGLQGQDVYEVSGLVVGAALVALPSSSCPSFIVAQTLLCFHASACALVVSKDSFCTITGAVFHSAWSQQCFVRCRSLQPPMAWIRCFHGVILLRCGPPRSLRGALQAVLSSSTTMCCTEFSIQLMRLGANVS